MRTALSDALPSTPSDIVIGGRYRVVRRLGRGGMGDIFEAENLWTKRRVALKTMRPEHADNGELTRRFQREAQAASQLSHPHVVDVLDMGEDAPTGALFIVQELLAGHDLRAHLDAAGRQPLADVLAWALPVMDALAAAHALGLVHRDLKPDNIFLAETPRGVAPKLIDFGIARHHEPDGDVGRTRTGMLLGTPAYMAPEQAVGDTALDARADIWSLGVVVYEALSGQRPHAACTTGAMLAKVIYEDPRPLGELAPDLPADLVAAVMGALHRDPAQRYPTIRAFEAALRACAPDAQPPRPAAPTPPLLSAPAVVPAPTFAPRISDVPVVTAAQPATRFRAALMALAGVALALSVGVGWTRRPPASPARAAASPVMPPAPSAHVVDPTLVTVATTPPAPALPVVARPVGAPAPRPRPASAASAHPARLRRHESEAVTAATPSPTAPTPPHSPFDPIE